MLTKLLLAGWTAIVISAAGVSFYATPASARPSLWDTYGTPNSVECQWEQRGFGQVWVCR